MKTTNKITNLLNKKPFTIQELATELGISRNSVHLQIRKLEAAGVVEKLAQRMSASAGKPAYQYRTSVGQEDVHSSAYKPVLDMLVKTIGEDLSDARRLKLFEETGRSLAKASGLKPGDDLRADIQKSIDAVNSLGAMAELTATGSSTSISCHSCPLATLVHHEPMTCCLVAAFFSEASGQDVSVECRKEGTVVCRFRFG